MLNPSEALAGWLLSLADGFRAASSRETSPPPPAGIPPERPDAMSVFPEKPSDDATPDVSPDTPAAGIPGTPVYLCRSCQGRFDGPQVTDSGWLMWAITTAHNSFASSDPKWAPTVAPHDCRAGQVGLGDFVGMTTP